MQELKVIASVKDLESFLQSDLRNGYIKFGNLSAYYVKSYRQINGERRPILIRGNTTNQKRSDNIEVNPRRKSTGQYKALCDLTEKLARDYGYAAVYVENVLNQFLPEVLLRYGYTEFTGPDDITRQFYKRL